MRAILRLALIVISALATAGCGKSYTYKYRITVAVRDHGQLISASNVVDVTETASPSRAIEPPRLCGEAVVVRLHNGTYLFGLLNGYSHGPVDGRHAEWLTSPTPVL